MPEERINKKKHLIYIFIVFITLIAIASSYYIIFDSKEDEILVEVPFITANKSPYKVKPLDPGGMHIPNMDKTVYDNISKEKIIHRKEKILPKAEEPITIDAFLESIEEEEKIKKTPKKQIVKKATKKLKIVRSKKNKSKNKYKIQLAAYRTKLEAENEWKQVTKKHHSLLKNLNKQIKVKDLGKKGLYYALQAGSIAKKSEARLICKKLIAKKQGCFVTK